MEPALLLEREGERMMDIWSLVLIERWNFVDIGRIINLQVFLIILRAFLVLLLKATREKMVLLKY